MKIALIQNINKQKDFYKIVGYNEVMTWFITRGLLNCGHDVYLVGDNKTCIREMPDVEAAAIFSSDAIHLVRNNPELFDIIKSHSDRQYTFSDGPSRSIFRIHGPNYLKDADVSSAVFYGLGVDRSYCRPFLGGNTIILWNAWNDCVLKGTFSEDMERTVEAFYRVKEKADVKIWGLNVSHPVCDYVVCDIVPKGPKGNRPLGYRPWNEIVGYYESGTIFFDNTPKMIELGRVEAGACGNHCISPADGATKHIMSKGWPDLEHMDYTYYDNDDDLSELIMNVIEKADRYKTHEKVTSWFTWNKVVDCVLEGFTK